MSLLCGYLRRPRKVWLRQISFQIHLWIGLILTLYLIMIGVTGSILVFREDLENLAGLNPWRSLQTEGTRADPVAVVANVRASFPQARLISIQAPNRSNPVFIARLQGRGRNFGMGRVAIHPVTAQVLGRMPRRLPPNWAWLEFVRNLHTTLLLGIKGRELNGGLAGALLLINFTGIVIWWPGLKLWIRALRIDCARNWRRINFDLHRAIGFWAIAVVSFWGISGVYFGWPAEARRLVDRISPLDSAVPPAVTIEARDAPIADLHVMLATASRLDSGASLREIAFPSGRHAPLEISMQRPGTRGAEFADTLYFDPWDGRCVRIWKYGVNRSAGDWVVWLQIPLHFGTFWGLGAKILWAAVSLSIPLLCVTGVLMYWNRYLRSHWRLLFPS